MLKTLEYKKSVAENGKYIVRSIYFMLRTSHNNSGNIFTILLKSAFIFLQEKVSVQMSRIQRLKEHLNKPFPFAFKAWKRTLLASLFTTLFLILFKPHGLFGSILHPNIAAIGFGAVAFLCSVFLFFLCPVLFPVFFNSNKWTMGKRYLEYVLLLLLATVANYIYALAFVDLLYSGWRGFTYIFLLTFIVSFSSFIIVNLVASIVALKNTLKNTTEINELITSRSSFKHNREIVIESESGKTSVNINTLDIIYIQADGNYLQINYLKNGTSTMLMIRNTLKYIDQLLKADTYLYKCHRSYIINVMHVSKIRSNANAYKVYLKHTTNEIPVSRNSINCFKELLNILATNE